LSRARRRWLLRAFVYERGSQIMKPQKWGKAPISSAMTCAGGGTGRPGAVRWVGRERRAGRQAVGLTPHVQVTACSEDQTDNVWRALLPMIQLGPLADVFRDSGLTSINLPTGGLIEPVTAAAVSRLGQRVTFVVQDQTESWLQSNGGHKLGDNQRRGLAGTGGRFLETPNAFDPAEDSVAQRTFESKAPGVFRDYAEPPAGSVRNKRERRKVLQSVYGDSVIERGGWIDLERIDAEIEALLEHDPAQAERWFMNRTMASEGSAFDFEQWKRLAKPWLMNRPRPVAWAVRNLEQAVSSGDLSHDGDETLVRHFANARRVKLTVLDDRERQMHTIGKDGIGSPRKMDGAAAAVLAWEARGDCISAGAYIGDDIAADDKPKVKPWEPGMALPASRCWWVAATRRALWASCRETNTQRRRDPS
jgi:hypothetical protein